MKYRDHTRQEHVDDAQWKYCGRVHDWRNHVGENTKAIWHTFTSAQRMALAADADDRASAEHWD